jgi:hypoxanthine-guanine phosphoribosyltransferase
MEFMMTVNVTSLTNGYHPNPNKYGVLLLNESQIARGIREIAERINTEVDCGSIGIIGLSNSADNFRIALGNSKALQNRDVTTVSLAVFDRENDKHIALARAASAFDWNCGFKNIMLLDAERVSGESLATAYQIAQAELKDRDVNLWTACLIDRSDCVNPDYRVPIHFCGFRVVNTTMGKLYGYGMDLRNRYRHITSVFYTIRDNDCYRPPHNGEGPRVFVPGSPSGETLDEWWGEDCGRSRHGQ